MSSSQFGKVFLYVGGFVLVLIILRGCFFSGDDEQTHAALPQNQPQAYDQMAPVYNQPQQAAPAPQAQQPIIVQQPSGGGSDAMLGVLGGMAVGSMLSGNNNGGGTRVIERHHYRPAPTAQRPSYAPPRPRTSYAAPTRSRTTFGSTTKIKKH